MTGRITAFRATDLAAGAAQSAEEAAEARAAGAESAAQRAELARLEAQAAQLQGFELATLDHAELMALIDLQMQARVHQEDHVQFLLYSRRVLYSPYSTPCTYLMRFVVQVCTHLLLCTRQATQHGPVSGTAQ